MECVNVGVFGHIDHGKTTLLSKLSGKWTDTHSEELKRGITIKLGYADRIIGKPEKYVTFIDAPGHEMLMATMLSGAAIIDAAILVIAANEGIKPQTREHLVGLQAKKIKNIIIVQNKIDLVSKEEALANYKKIKEFIKGTIAESAQIIPISAQQGVNIDKILDAICNIKVEKRSAEGNPIFLIARSFDINRPGSNVKNLKGGILGGVLKHGTLKIGDEIEIKPGRSYEKANKFIYETIYSKVNAIFQGKYSVKEARPGPSIAIETELDPCLTKADSLSGCILSRKDKLPEIKNKIKIKVDLFKEVLGMQEKKPVEPIKTNEYIMLSINTTTTVGSVVKINKDEAELFLKIPVVALKGDNVGIARNINGHWRLIGFGEII
ncbi:translation initiation factor IF-2 subunit gamma [Candidatus Woesearchaeota archaeon CG10_big_fil_rev_8_21_14_0_10_34_12]|nr:MAG: translation initiation factor IF-2 subunit gamma [Candidatus Woesearchaeota archaeon CG10_big_fil_rev_8_21_14_0_10_34_12]